MMEKQEEEDVKRRQRQKAATSLGFLHWEELKNHGDLSKVALNIALTTLVDDASTGFCIMNLVNLIVLRESSQGYLLTYEGKLASLASATYVKAFISLWVLEDAERHAWSFRTFSLTFPLDDPILDTFLELTGVTEAGEFVYAPTTLQSPFHALYFDPQRNSFRRVIYEGLADDEFRRRNRLGYERHHILPNHIESLISL